MIDGGMITNIIVLGETLDPSLRISEIVVIVTANAIEATLLITSSVMKLLISAKKEMNFGRGN
jgi:hypothetical protein